MAAAEIFFEHERWGRNLAWSAGFHIAIAASILAYTVIAPGSRGEGWGAGGGGDAMGVTLVSTVPLPANPVQTQNVLANESKGLSQSQPKPEVKEPEARRLIRNRSRNRNPWKKQTTLCPSAKGDQLAVLTAYSVQAGPREALALPAVEATSAAVTPGTCVWFSKKFQKTG